MLNYSPWYLPPLSLMSGVTLPDEWGHSTWRVGVEMRESDLRVQQDFLFSMGIVHVLNSSYEGLFSDLSSQKESPFHTEKVRVINQSGIRRHEKQTFFAFCFYHFIVIPIFAHPSPKTLWPAGRSAGRGSIYGKAFTMTLCSWHLGISQISVSQRQSNGECPSGYVIDVCLHTFLYIIV